MHVLAETVARTWGQMLNEGFSRKRLREWLQCFASERGKTGAEIVSPLLDERKGGSIRHSRQAKTREKGKRMSELTIKVHTKEDCGHIHHMML